MKKVLTTSLFILLFFDKGNAHSPTWTDGIACIIYSHCSSCHNSNGVAPFPLMSYNDVYQNRFSIAASVQSKSMPPFPATQDKRKYAHSNTLSAHEINEIVEWVNNFAPLGDANNIPAAPTFSTAYQIRNPDFTARIPKYTVSSNKDVYRVFAIPVNNAVLQTIQSIEVVPGNRDIVHHALVFQDTSDIPFNLDKNDPLPGYSAFGGTGSKSSKLLTVFTPGQGAFTFAPGFGTSLLPKSYIILQIHYPGGVIGRVDSTQIRLKFASTTLRSISTSAVLNHNFTLQNGPLTIPANTVKTFYSKVTSNQNRTLTGIMPHMHLIGVSIKAFAVTPSADTISLIDIPKWDFHWQYFYQFQKPIFLPAGTVLYGEATYDNTSNNPYNPNSPPKEVKQGEGTEDEMFLIYMNLSTYMAGDSNIIIDTTNHLKHDASCFETSSTDNIHGSDIVPINIYPNPVSEMLYLSEKSRYSVLSNDGRVLLHSEEATHQFNVSALPTGVYFLKTDKGIVKFKKE